MHPPELSSRIHNSPQVKNATLREMVERQDLKIVGRSFLADELEIEADSSIEPEEESGESEEEGDEFGSSSTSSGDYESDESPVSDEDSSSLSDFDAY